jgi:kumamolisin
MSTIQARSQVALCVAAAALLIGATPAAAAPVKTLIELDHPRGLETFVRSVSDPTSPTYRDYLTVEQLAKRFGASKRDRRAARRWVARAGGTARLAPDGVTLIATLPATKSFKAPGPMAVPDGLGDSARSLTVLDPRPVVEPAARVSARGSALPHSGTAAGCIEGQNAGQPPPDTGFTPNQYLSAYGHARLHQTGITGRGARAAVIEIDGFNRSDIAAFGACFGTRIPPIKLHLAGISKPLAAGLETTLDLETLSAAAPGLKSIEVYEGGASAAGILLSTAMALARPANRPEVLSVSLEGCEADLTGQLAYVRALDRLYALAAGAGISVLVASGDQGSSMCTNRAGDLLSNLAVSNTASSPFATGVGGTNLSLDPDNAIVDQVVWNDAPLSAGGGGGGISLLYDAPWWQRKQSSIGTGNARLVPDVAALADVEPGYAIYCTGAPECASAPQNYPGWVSPGGTSVATPLTAGGVLLANQVARKRGQPPLGFVNPLLYAAGPSKGGRSVFSDVTHGDNDLGTMIGPPTGDGQPLGGFSAKAGYDLASGWGSVDIPALAKYAVRAAQ